MLVHIGGVEMLLLSVSSHILISPHIISIALLLHLLGLLVSILYRLGLGLMDFLGAIIPIADFLIGFLLILLVGIEIVK
jgi:hypothetical protein